MNELILNKKRILQGLIISVVIGIVSFLIITQITNSQNIWSSLSYLDKRYLFLSLALIIGAAAIDALRIKMAVEAVKEEITFIEALKVYYISNFAGGITPFFSGTIPTQIYLFHKNIRPQIPLGKATMIATIIPLFKTLVFTILTPVIFLYYRKTLTNYATISIVLINAVILFSLFLIFLFILAAKFPKILREIISKIQRLPYISKLFQKEKIAHLVNQLILEIEEFHQSFDLFKENRIKILGVALYTAIFYGIFFLIAPLILCGFHIDFHLSYVLVLQIIFYFVLPFMPTPGGSGTAEASFASLFSFFIPPYLLGPFVGVWRFVTFYFNLGIGGIVLFIEIKKWKKK